ncbi:Predicted transcriptional regulator (fragment) [uncultured Alphaproteobacteria bacterium]|uniref:Predicted transcriptional regulator n=1 Tax=uncultured Alphaproteobacteria bacterium TaxID=91750 RepID=A0A212K057_9PROT
MMNLKQHIGLRVKSARREKGLTQEELADRIGKAVATLSNIERGEALTGLETLALIAQATDKPMVFFFEGIEDTRLVSRKRLEAEDELRLQAKRLTDQHLLLAQEILAAMERAQS